MNTNRSKDRLSDQIDQMIQTDPKERPNHFMRRKNEIIDFIMANPNLPLTNNQIAFLLRSSTPAVNPMRKDYFDVLARLVTEAKKLGDTLLIKHIYLSMPFYPADWDDSKKIDFFQGGIKYFLSLGMDKAVGELYVYLAGMYGYVKERIVFCEKALEYLDTTFSKEYACVLAMREMLCYMEHQKYEEFYRYSAFGEKIIRKGKSIFLSPVYSNYLSLKKEESLCSDIVILKGNMGFYETLTSFDSSGYDKEIADESMSFVASKKKFDEKVLVRCPDEKLICKADGKEYLCNVFAIRRSEDPNNMISEDIIETNYYADGIGLIRAVLSTGDKTWIYDLCECTIKGGGGMIPCCVGNQWYYLQEDCPHYIDQVIKREIVAQNGDEYLLSGWNCAGRNTL